MVRQLEEERKNRSKWYPIAPDGEIPNSVIRDLLANLTGNAPSEHKLEFNDIALLIAKVMSYFSFHWQHVEKYSIVCSRTHLELWLYRRTLQDIFSTPLYILCIGVSNVFILHFLLNVYLYC